MFRKTALDILTEDFDRIWPGSTGRSYATLPNYSFSTEDQKLVCKVELPGVSKEQVQVSVSPGGGSRLEIQAPKYDSFHLRAAPGYDVTRASCKMRDGLLVITIPPVAQPPAISIPIE